MDDRIFGSSEELCKWIVEELGPEYKQYVDQFMDDGVDGELLAQLDYDEMAGLVENTEHRRTLTQAVVDLMSFNTETDDYNNLLCPKDHIRNAVANLDEWEIVTWLELLGEPYAKLAETFFDNGIDGQLLLQLSSEDFEELVKDPVQRQVVMSEIKNPTPTFLAAILREKPQVSRKQGAGNRRRSVVVNGTMKNDITNYSAGLSMNSNEVSAFFDEALEQTKTEDNLLPWLTRNGFSHHYIALQNNGCTLEILKAIPTIEHLHKLGVKSTDASNLFDKVIELRVNAEETVHSEFPRQRGHPTRSRAVSDASDCSDISDISPDEGPPRFRTDWAVLACARFLPEVEACDFLSQIWRSHANRSALVAAKRAQVEGVLVNTIQQFQAQREHHGNYLEELSSLARFAFALNVKVNSVFSEVSGATYQLPRQLVLELFDFGYSSDTTGFPILHSSEDRGSLFHCFLLASIRADAHLNFQDLVALTPRTDVRTRNGLTTLDIVGEFLRTGNQVKTSLKMFGLLQYYGFTRDPRDLSIEESESITAYRAYEKKARSIILSVNWLKKKVRIALANITFGEIAGPE